MSAILLLAEALLLGAVGSPVTPVASETAPQVSAAPAGSMGTAASRVADTAADSRVTALIEVAARQYDQGLLDDALQTLQRARSLSARPGILFDIAQVQRGRKDCSAALAAYEAFVAQVDVADPDRERALRRIAEMQECVAGEAAPLPSSPPATPAPAPSPAAQAPKGVAPPGFVAEPPGAVDPARSAVVSIATTPAVASGAEARRREARLAGWSLIALGGLCEVGAVLLQWRALGIQSDVEHRNPPYDAVDWKRLHDEGSRDARWALWATVAGGVFGAAGGALLIVNGRPRETQATTAFVQWGGSF
jgi:hypothetical protein